MPSIAFQVGGMRLDLDSVHQSGFGLQVLSGFTGAGLPPVSGQWVDGAGDGSQWRGERMTARDMDLPLVVVGRNRPELKRNLNRLVGALVSDSLTLIFTDDEGNDWTTAVHRVGGGDYIYGQDTIGELDCRFVVTLRAGDPYWTAAMPTVAETIVSNSTWGLLDGGSFANLRLSPGQTQGQMTLENVGTANAWPVWSILGPASRFTATSPQGETFIWEGSLSAGDVLTFDTLNGSVTDQHGVNRYDGMHAAPRFWPIRPGVNLAIAVIDGATPGVSAIRAEWQARNWVVI